MRRLFIPPDWIEVDKVVFPSEFTLRLRALGFEEGDHLVVLDDSGWEHEITLTEVDSGGAIAWVVKKTLASGERRTKISLYQGLVAPDDFEEILRRGTELGIVEFVPLVCDRCRVPDLDTFDEVMLEDWRETIERVATESMRGRLPRLGPAVLFDVGLERATRRGKSLIVWDGENGRDLHVALEHNPFSIRLFAPPPAGFTPDEVDRANQRGVVPVRPPFDPNETTSVGLWTSQAIFEQLG